MNSESPDRYRLAIDSLDVDVDMVQLAHMLVIACESVLQSGGVPEDDAAVAIISGRIGFASPADTMSEENWNAMVKACQNGDKIILQVKPERIQ